MQPVLKNDRSRLERLLPGIALVALVALALGAAQAPTAADPIVGGSNETSEDFGPAGGWRTLNMTPGCLPAGVTLSGTHLLISEVAPRGAGTGTVSDSSEYIEIYNPTTDPVSLDDYYVSDDFNYHRIVNGPYTTFTGDYNLRFPPGSTILPGEVVLVVKSELGFLASFGGLAGTAGFCTTKIFAMETRVHPPTVFTPMIDAAGASLYTGATGVDPTVFGALTNPASTGGEWVVLYRWDGASDLVCDVDYASWGPTNTTNAKVDKSGLSVDGPDLDTCPSAYNSDTPAVAQSNLGSSTGLVKPNTYQRVDGEVGQLLSGGNGCTDGVIIPHNTPPTMDPIADQSVGAGSLLTFTVTATDCGAPPQLLTFTPEAFPAGASITPDGVFSWMPDATWTGATVGVTVRVTDNGTPPLSADGLLLIHVQGTNRPPALVDLPGPITVNQGDPVSFIVVATDPDMPANALTLSLVPPTPPDASISPGEGVIPRLATVSWTGSTVGDFVFRIQVDDGQGGIATGDVLVTVANVPPTATILGPATGSVFPVGSAVTFTGSFADPGSPGPHRADWMFDTIHLAGTVDEAAHTVAGTYTFTTPGVYMVRLVVTDEYGATGEAYQVDGMDAMIVVYDPDVGFVTGGGWIDSPPGAYVPDPALAGKANFGFVSRYRRGATLPTGETEFQFRVADLNFHSVGYDWLVIAGARAQYKGWGTVNGTGNYGFTLTATDGDLMEGGQGDLFRIKIRDLSTGDLVYDNQPGAADGADPVTALGGGSIVIHTPIRSARATATPGAPEPAGTSAPIAYRLSQNEPNPVSRSTLIRYELPVPGKVRLELYSVAGRLVKTLIDEERAAGRHEARWSGEDSDGLRLGAGVYFYRITVEPAAGGPGFASHRRMVILN